MEKRERRFWGISIGESGRYVSYARHGNYVAIGWNELGDMGTWVERRDEDQREAWHEFKAFYGKVFPQATQVVLGIQAGQVVNFVMNMSIGDIVLIRDTLALEVHIAEVASGYMHVEAPDDGCHYENRRAVRWLREGVKREELPEVLKTSLYSQLTVFSLDKRRDEIEWLLGGPRPSDAGGLVQVVRKRLMGLTPYEFQQFVGDILSLAGFTVVVSEVGPDGGVDIIGTLNAGNLAEITVRVQVKRISGNTGIKDILALRGTLQEMEQGAFITLGGFTKAARQEAEAPGKRKVRPIDGEEFVDLILEHYDELPGEYRNLLGLERLKIPLRDQFAISTEGGGVP